LPGRFRPFAFFFAFFFVVFFGVIFFFAIAAFSFVNSAVGDAQC
jgi:hypothetical protein